MKKNLIEKLALWCGLLLLAVSCTDETESMGQAASLAMEIRVDGSESRAIIEDGALPEGSFVGVTVVDASGTTYNGLEYNNIKGTTNGTQLSLAEEVLITDNDATIYSYYPWTDGISETAVPLVAGETDYLYAKPITGVNNGNATAILSMSHALACLRLNISRGYYSGTGELTTLSITSDALSTAGTLNARTGTVTATGTGIYETELSQTVTDATITRDIMVVPTGNAGEITFSILVDGNEYYVTGPSITLQAGSIYEYNIEIEKNPWDGLANGVYAVSADDKPVDYTTADATATGVALVAGEHKFMIAKADATDGTNTTLYWSKNLYRKDVAGVVNNGKVDGTNDWGYLPKPNGTFAGSTHLSGDFTTWTAGALSEFNGNANTAAIIAAYTEHGVSMDARDMCTVLNTFNASDSFKDWYVPACGQLALMWLNITEINAALAKIGGTELAAGYFWSSSELSSSYAWYVNFNGGSVVNDVKGSYNCRVRFIRNIE